MIELQHVSFQYEEANTPALSDVSLSIKPGEMIAIVGHNGSGKSTLAKHLNALLLPTGGAILVDGMDTKDEDKTLAIRQKVGMVFQNPDNQLVTSIVEEDVGFGPENLGVPPAEIRERVAKALSEVNMLPYADKASHSLSGGQKQRIAIAGMLAMHPEVLVLDEATAMLDPSGRSEVLSTVTRLNHDDGMTVVMITQYMEEAVGCDRIAVMAKGKLEMLGTPREIFAQAERLRALGLDVPVMIAMREELKKQGLPIAGDPMDCKELGKAICQLLSNN